MFVVLVGLAAGPVAGIAIAALVIGFVIGALLTSWHIKKQIHQNPLISEAQIRALYSQTGRKLSEAEVMRIMKSIQQKD